jgi:hypothetical protein
MKKSDTTSSGLVLERKRPRMEDADRTNAARHNKVKDRANVGRYFELEAALSGR